MEVGKRHRWEDGLKGERKDEWKENSMLAFLGLLVQKRKQRLLYRAALIILFKCKFLSDQLFCVIYFFGSQEHSLHINSSKLVQNMHRLCWANPRLCLVVLRQIFCVKCFNSNLFFVPMRLWSQNSFFLETKVL